MYRKLAEYIYYNTSVTYAHQDGVSFYKHEKEVENLIKEIEAAIIQWLNKKNDS